MADVSRRHFFKLLGGAVALTAVPLRPIENLVEIPVEFGWTWRIPGYKDNPHSEFSKIITETLRANRAKLAENVSQNNALYIKLKEGQKIKLNIERIDPDEQTKRMAERMKAKLPPPAIKYAETFGDFKTGEEFAKTQAPYGFRPPINT